MTEKVKGWYGQESGGSMGRKQTMKWKEEHKDGEIETKTD